jgi:hypothetical protein
MLAAGLTQVLADNFTCEVITPEQFIRNGPRRNMGPPSAIVLDSSGRELELLRLARCRLPGVPLIYWCSPIAGLNLPQLDEWGVQATLRDGSTPEEVRNRITAVTAWRGWSAGPPQPTAKNKAK